MSSGILSWTFFNVMLSYKSNYMFKKVDKILILSKNESNMSGIYFPMQGG